MAKDPSPDVVATWPPPNLVNPETRGNGLRIMESMMIGVVLLVVILRVYARAVVGRTFGYDDWTILPATIFCIALTITTSLGNDQYGWGKHAWDVPVPVREKALQLSMFAEIFFTWSLGLTKLSLCLFYVRLLGTASAFRRWVIYGMVGLIVVWTLGFTVATIFQCTPIKAMWIINYPGEHCLDQTMGVILHASLDVFSDGILYCLPIPATWRLPLPLKQKILVLGLFALGGLVWVITILRLPATIHSMNTYDVTWAMWNAYFLTVFECDLGIICASLPSLAPLIFRVFPCLARRPSHVSTTSSPSSQKPSVLRLYPDYSYPLGNISSVAYPERALSTTHGGTGWWGTHHKSHDKNESEENIFPGAESKEADFGNKGITKTTTIEQKYEEETGGVVVQQEDRRLSLP